jgi:hypothetical protein
MRAERERNREIEISSFKGLDGSPSRLKMTLAADRAEGRAVTNWRRAEWRKATNGRGQEDSTGKMMSFIWKEKRERWYQSESHIHS